MTDFQLIVELLTKMRLTEDTAGDKHQQILTASLQEGNDNLLEFLFRDQPRKMGIDLLIRGHHKVGQFLMDFKTIPTCLKDKVEDKMANYEFNYWSLKIVTRHMKLPINQVSRLVKIINQHSPTSFLGRGQVIQSLLILYQELEHGTNLKHFQRNHDIHWLRLTWRNRCVVVRSLGYQITSRLATSDQGANLLTTDFTDLWKTFMEVVQSNGESSLVKTNTLSTLYNLLVLVSIQHSSRKFLKKWIRHSIKV